MDDKEQTPFRIGSIYRQRDGTLVKLVERTRDARPSAYAKKQDSRGNWTVSFGGNYLDDGSDLSNEGEQYHLIPGECDEHGNPLPTFTATLDRPAPTPKVKAALDLLEQGFKAQNETRCCCGEPEATGVVHRVGAPCYYEDSPEVDTTWRPALDWADPTPFDAHRGFFDDWTATSGGEDCAARTNHPAQRLAESGAKLSTDFALAAVRQLVR